MIRVVEIFRAPGEWAVSFHVVRRKWSWRRFRFVEDIGTELQARSDYGHVWRYFPSGARCDYEGPLHEILNAHLSRDRWCSAETP